MSINIILSICVLMFIIYIIYRNKLITKYRMIALEITKEKAERAIRNHDFKWERFYKKLDSYGSYGQMIWDIKKWRFEDFYPDINE